MRELQRRSWRPQDRLNPILTDVSITDINLSLRFADLGY